MIKKKRRSRSIKEELLCKSQEAMLSAVQIFNNPNISFKAESFVVLSNIAWTYFLHAYFRNQHIDYRHHRLVKTRKRFDKTKLGAYKYWELEKCLEHPNSPVDKVTSSNLKFLIGLRHEIEHQMTTRIDEYLSARFQACCLNYNFLIKKLFSHTYGIDKYLSFSLQFSSISDDHAKQLRYFTDLPKNISSYINAFDNSLSKEEYNDTRFSYRVLYVPKTVNHPGQADKVIEFIPANAVEAEQLNKEYVIIKDRERRKLLPTTIWKEMKAKGFTKFGQHQHAQLWRTINAKAPDKGFGILVEKTWYWYESWLSEVEKHCNESGNKYK